MNAPMAADQNSDCGTTSTSPGLHGDVLLHVALVDQIVQAHANLGILAVFRAHDLGAVTRGELPETTDGEHDVQQPSRPSR